MYKIKPSRDMHYSLSKTQDVCVVGDIAVPQTETVLFPLDFILI